MEMEFTLHYSGPLKSGQGSRIGQHKLELRRHFHPQLRSFLRDYAGQFPFDAVAKTTYMVALQSKSLRIERDGFTYVPLVNSKHRLFASLDITMLQPGPVGSVLAQGGDIDNRLKTLFDALKMPDEGAVPGGTKPGHDEDPFFCLLEDDALVTRVSVDTDRLWMDADQLGTSHVELLLRVKVRQARPDTAFGLQSEHPPEKKS